MQLSDHLVFDSHGMHGDGHLGGLIAQVEQAARFSQADKDQAFLSIRQAQVEQAGDGHRALADGFVLALASQRDAVANAHPQFLGHPLADQDHIFVIILEKAARDDILGDQADRRFDRGLDDR